MGFNLSLLAKKIWEGEIKLTLSELLGIRYPIIQAPMAGVTTPEFVATSAEVGMLGSIGAGYLSAEETQKFIRKVQMLTNRSFAVNLFVPEEIEVSQTQLSRAYEALQPIEKELGISSKPMSFSKSEFAEQILVLIDEEVKVCSFTFGLPDEKTVKLLKENDVFLIGTATTVEEAVLVEKAGLDAVVAQGSEAGGHRGSFLGELTFIPLQQLLSEIVVSVNIPVIAAGGIANKEMVEGARLAGAAAVQIGTAFLVANESDANPVHKKAILNAAEGDTVITTAFSGKAARGIRNRFTEEMKDAKVAPYPYQNDLTKEIRKVTASEGKSDYMSLWAGENVHLSSEGSLEEIMKRFI